MNQKEMEEIMKSLRARCTKCNELQKPDEEKSNENWLYYDYHKKCRCGGKFKIIQNNPLNLDTEE